MDDQDLFKKGVEMWRERVPSYVYLTKDGALPLPPPDAKTATKEEMENAKADVEAFIIQSDVYQDCLAKLTTKFADRLSDNDKRLLAAAADRSQQEKEALGNDYNKLVDAYNKLHK